jgi:hypothetical protein
MSKYLRWAAVFVVLAAGLCVPPSAAMAWKPFAHNYTGDQAYADAVDDGSVTIAAHSYPLDSRLVAALRAKPEFYNAGVVGPDGFPDLIYGQSQIHPVHTGEWLRYIVEQAWAAQSDPQYGADERQQILAFAYGFLTHAAGDMWAHTLVNDFAGGVFPAFKELINPDKAKIALRHLIAEGYAGNATPGWDRSVDEDDRAQVCTPPGPPGTNCDDVSDDQTHGIPFDAPHRFIYNTLVDPRVPLPVGTCNDNVDDDGDGVADDGCPGRSYTVGSPEPQRGPLLDFFLDLEASVQINAADYRFDADHTNCTTIDPDCFDADRQIVVHTVRGDKTITVDATRCDATLFCVADPVDGVGDLINGLIAGYLEAWVDDIEDGLRHWSEFSLGVTKGLFDPQARRDAQNDACHTRGPESSIVRANCENAIGALDTIGFETDDYINGHMLSMLGLPDAVGPIREALDALADLLDEIVGPALNPFRLAIDEIKDAIKDLIKDEIRKATGVDVEEVKGFLTHPTRWMCGDAGVSITLPGVGTITGAGLFSAEEHARLDGIMGLEPDHHEPGTTISTDCSPLEEDAEYDPNEFTPIKNTITQAKLLLLDGTELDHALGDILAGDGVIKNRSLVKTYQSNDNVMFTALGTSTSWLDLIDGDHAWRQDGLPRFCDNASSCSSLPGDVAAQLAPYPRPPTPRDTNPDTGELLNGGTGRYPIWESCVLRPAFRELFEDWENAANTSETNFPDLGDGTSPDPATDPNPPTIEPLALTGTTFTAGGTTFIGGDVNFAATAHDDVFTDDALELEYRTYPAGGTPGDFQPLDNGDSFSLPDDAQDGLWVVDVRVADGCGSRLRSETFTLDTHGPAIAIDSPAPEGIVFDTDDLSHIHYSADDGPLGSGVKTTSVTLDGTPATNGQTLDMFLLAPGTHTIEVTAVDNLNNTSVATRHFEVHATSQSLINNVDRACTSGLISKTGTCNSLSAKLRAALAAHDRGQHGVEANILGAFINELSAQRAKSVDAATADRFIAYAQDLIQRGT